MTQANDSILVTPGSGATVATHTVSSKEYQVVMQAAESGHIIGSKDTFYAVIPSQVHVAAANTVHWDLFNADAAILVRAVSIKQIPNITTAVTGVVRAARQAADAAQTQARAQVAAAEAAQAIARADARARRRKQQQLVVLLA